MKRRLPDGIAIVVLGPSGAALGRHLQAVLPGAELHGPRARSGDWDIVYDQAAAHIASLFAAGQPIVGICASGILIRSVAPLLAAKEHEPPVVAVAEDGSVAVPLIGGHHGANAIARAVAAVDRTEPPRSPQPAICGSAWRSTNRHPAGASPIRSGSSRLPPRCSPASLSR